MDIKQLEKVIKLVEKSDINELKFEEDGIKIEIVKQDNSIQVAQTTPVNTVFQQPIQVDQAVSTAPAASVSPATTASTIAEGEITINAPMVGTFYSAPSPESPVYLKVGDHIKKGDPVCIIEAMKLFNEIESEVSGVVTKILVDNENIVEFGQPLIAVKADA